MPVDPIQMLQSMVEIPSVSGEEQALAEYLTDTMENLGFDSTIDEAGNTVGIIGDGPRDVVLLGHIDTVPGGPPVRIEDGQLYGRGSVDAKGPMATFVQAASQAETNGNSRIIVVGVVEEEVQTSKGARYIVDKYRPEYCIIGEPSGWDAMTIGYKGRLLVEYSHRKPWTHPAADETSAADDAFTCWEGIRQFTSSYNNDNSKQFIQLQSRINEIATSNEDAYQSVRSTFAFRLPPDLGPAQLIESLEKLTDQPGEFKTVEAVPAFSGSRRTPLHRAFLGAIRDGGGTPRFKRKTGTSDMNIVGPAWNCPILAYGPGDSSLDHTPNEHIDLDEYQRSITIVTNVLEHLAQEEEQ